MGFIRSYRLSGGACCGILVPLALRFYLMVRLRSPSILSAVEGLILSYAKNLKFFLEFVACSDALSSLGLFLEYFYHLDIFHLEKLIIKLADGPKKIRRPKADYFIRVFA